MRLELNSVDQTEEERLDHKHRMMVFSALFSAFIAAGAYLIIPIGPVPIVLQNLFVLLAGLLLGSRWGVTSVAVYMVAGICGLPVFLWRYCRIAAFCRPDWGISDRFFTRSLYCRFGFRKNRSTDCTPGISYDWGNFGDL